jgi:hypothetical protein
MSIFTGCRPILGEFQIPNMNKNRSTVQATARRTAIHTHRDSIKNTFSNGAPSENKPTALSLHQPIRFSDLKH